MTEPLGETLFSLTPLFPLFPDVAEESAVIPSRIITTSRGISGDMIRQARELGDIETRITRSCLVGEIET